MQSQLGIKETLDVLALGVAFTKRTREVYGDQKLTFFEKMSFVSLLGETIEALKGISSVPRELADLDEMEKETIKEQVRLLCQQMGVSYRTQDITDEILDTAWQLVTAVIRVLNMPPSAEPVVE
jgi:hypothetical protein